MNSYFKKISSPEDASATSSLSFSLNHTTAIVLPAL
jgi:hypothetical protein